VKNQNQTPFLDSGFTVVISSVKDTSALYLSADNTGFSTCGRHPCIFLRKCRL